MKRFVVAFSLLIGLTFAGSANAALLLGKTISVGYFYNGSQMSSWTGQGNFVVGSGPETTIGIPLSTGGVSEIFRVDLADDTVTITSLVTSNVQASSDGFNGIRFSDVLSQIPDFLSFTYVSGTLAAVGSFAANTFLVNFTPGPVTTGQSVTFRLTAAQPPTVPVPAALPLFMSAIAGFGLAMRKRKAA